MPNTPSCAVRWCSAWTPNPNRQAEKGRAEVLVATPNRLLDHIRAKTACSTKFEYVVLDGADHARHRLSARLAAHLSYLPKQRTALLFSATFSPEIKRLASRLSARPVTIGGRSNASFHRGAAFHRGAR